VNVYDSSALLAFLQGEDGAVDVEESLSEGGLCGAANWSEAAQKVRARGRRWDLASALLASYGVAVEPVTEADAEWAASRWQSGEGFSLADRLCLALGERVDATVWTADRSWGHDGRIRQIR
jgi:ribonuclease VapC